MEEQIKRLTLQDGLQVGIKKLNSILSEVALLGLTDPNLLEQELLERVKANGNYVPPSAEDEYAASLLREYRSKYGETEEVREKSRVKPHKHTKG